MNPWGIGIAQRAIGRIFLKMNELSKAEVQFQEAFGSFDTIQAWPDKARTHLDIAILAQEQGNPNIAITHLNKAYSWFKKLQVPKYIEHCEKIAREYGIR
jgi:hypothetical protein